MKLPNLRGIFGRGETPESAAEAPPSFIIGGVRFEVTETRDHVCLTSCVGDTDDSKKVRRLVREKLKERGFEVQGSYEEPSDLYKKRPTLHEDIPSQGRPVTYAAVIEVCESLESQIRYKSALEGHRLADEQLSALEADTQRTAQKSKRAVRPYFVEASNYLEKKGIDLSTEQRDGLLRALARVHLREQETGSSRGRSV